MENEYSLNSRFEKFSSYYFSSFTIKESLLFVLIVFALFLLSNVGLSIRTHTSFINLLLDFSATRPLMLKYGSLILIILAPILRIPVFYANWRSRVIIKEDCLLFLRKRLLLRNLQAQIKYSEIDKVILGDNGDVTCVAKKESEFIPSYVTFYKLEYSKQREIMNFLKNKIPNISNIIYKSTSYSINKYNYFQT